MLPVLFSIGKFPISSFGFFLALAFLFGLFLAYRLARAWELDEEKILDLSLLTFFGGLIGARLYFILGYQEIFLTDFIKIFSLVRYPGLSFWGAFLGGFLTLYFFLKRSTLPIMTVLDIASVGVLGGLIIGSIGCFLGGCGLGIESNFLGVKMVGTVGLRFPVQLLDALLLSLLLLKMWPKAIHFHVPGVILGQVLIFLGVIKFLTDFLRHDKSGQIFNILLAFFGVYLLYKVLKRDITLDLKNTLEFIKLTLTDQNTRKIIVGNLTKIWYNQKTSFWWKFHNLNKILRRINVRVTPKDTRQD